MLKSQYISYDTGGAGGAILFLHIEFEEITTEQKEVKLKIYFIPIFDLFLKS